MIMGFRIFRINKYEPAESEKKLEEYAAKGEFIISSGIGIAYFKKGEQKKMRYCIEAAMFRPNKRKRALYEENGWSLVCRGSDMNIFASEYENAAAIHTDRSEYAHVIQKFHETAKKILIFMYIMAAIVLNLLYLFFPIATGGLVSSIVTVLIDTKLINVFLRAMIFGLILYIPILAFYLHDYTEAGKFIAGCIESGKSAEKALRGNKIMTALFVVIFAMGMLNLCAMLYCREKASTRTADFSDVPVQAITMDEIFGEENIKYLLSDEDARKYIDPEVRTGKEKGFKPWAEVRTSAVSDSYYDYWQCGAYIPEGKEYGRRVTLHGTYTEFETNWLAKRGFKELGEYHFFFFSEKDKEKAVLNTEDTTFESAEYILNEYSVYIIARKGNAVYEISTYLPPDSGLTVQKLFENISSAAIE